MLWATVLMVNAGITLWLLLSSSLGTFVLERTAATWGLTALSIFLSITWFVASMRKDGITVEWGRYHQPRPAPSRSPDPTVLPVLGAVLLGFCLAQVALLVTTVYLHRSLAHRSVRFAPGVQAVFRVLTWMLVGIRPRQWVAVHRKHHTFTDTPRDPHSPLVLGFTRVLFANALLYRKEARDPATTARYARDLPEDRWDRVLFNHAVLGLGLGVGLLVLLFGWQLRSSPRVSMRPTTCSVAARDQRGRTPMGSPTIRQHGDQQSVARLVGRRRGTPQQSPRRGHLESAQPRCGRGRPRRGGASGCWCGCTGRPSAPPPAIPRWG